MAKEKMGSIARTLLAAGSGISLGLLVDHFEITAETLKSGLELAEKLMSSVQGILSLLGIFVAQGWSLYQKIKKETEIESLKKEIQYND